MDVQIYVSQQWLVRRVTERYTAHLDDWRGELLDFGEFEVHYILALWSFQNGHLFKFLDTRLRFGGFCGVVAELIDEALEMSSLDRLVLILALCRLPSLFLGVVERVCTDQHLKGIG